MNAGSTSFDPVQTENIYHRDSTLLVFSGLQNFQSPREALGMSNIRCLAQAARLAFPLIRQIKHKQAAGEGGGTGECPLPMSLCSKPRAKVQGSEA